MTAASAPPRRAFAVWWKELENWHVLSTLIRRQFRSSHPLRALKELVTVRWQAASAEQFTSGAVSMVDRVSFGGEIFAGGRCETKMQQFVAVPGDLVVSKIRARQGSIGLVDSTHGMVSVTIHYRVLTPLGELLNPSYAWLALRSSFCRAQFLAATGGAMKGEISEEGLLAVEIPLPPLAEQAAIVARWREAQTQIAAARARVEKVEAEIQRRFLADLGLKLPQFQQLPKAFAILWKDSERWGVAFNQQALGGLNPEAGKFPVVRLGEAIADLENGWSPQCLNRPAEGEEWGVLKLGAVSFGLFNDAENKALPPQLQPIPALEVKQGQVLISRANIPRLVGACALVAQTRPRLLLCDKIFRAVFRKESPIEPAYLAEVMKIPPLRRQIEAACTGTSATMQNITKPALLALRLPLPPLPVQREIVTRVQLGRAEIARERAAAARLTREITAEIEARILDTRASESRVPSLSPT